VCALQPSVYKGSTELGGCVETFVYIHGVVGERRRTQSHRGQYQSLHLGLAAEGVSVPPFSQAIQIEWGWTTARAGDTRNLEKAQRTIYDRVERATPKDRTNIGSLLFAPAIDPVRKLLALGWSDLIYYTGEEGKLRVRSLVWNEILRRVGADRPVDLALITHSAGSLIAHDFLFWLFSGARDAEIAATEELPAPDVFAAARANWRVRHFVTLGSPLAPTLVRSAHIVDMLAGSGTPRLSLDVLGLGRPAHDGREPLWLNVWDRHDVLSFPLEPFYAGGKLKDLYPDVSDALLGAHDAYFGSSGVQSLLARHWDD
jgi:hypothetical protein